MARPMVMLVHVAPALPENARTQGATISHTPTHAFVLSAPSEGLARAAPAAQATTKPQTTAFAATDPPPPSPSQGETSRTAPSTRLVQSIQDSVVVAEVLFKAFEFTILLQGVRGAARCRECMKRACDPWPTPLFHTRQESVVPEDSSPASRCCARRDNPENQA